MLISRPSQAPTNQGVNSRMKPARQMSSIRCRFEKNLHRPLELLAPGIDLVIDGGGRDAMRFGDGKPWRFGAVGQDKGDLGGIARIGRRFDQAAHVRAAAGNQDRGAFAAAHSTSRPVKSDARHRFDHFAKADRLFAGRAQLGFERRGAGARRSKPCRCRN